MLLLIIDNLGMEMYNIRVCGREDFIFYESLSRFIVTTIK